jgi:hypothetical protein
MEVYISIGAITFFYGMWVMANASFSVLAATSSSGVGISAYIAGIVIVLVFTSLLGGLMFYKVLEKGHQPAWASFIPFYNYALLFKMSGKNPALALLFVAGVIPVVGMIFTFIGLIMLGMAVGKAFGKSGGFTAGLILLGLIFYPILGFGSSRYILDGAAPAQGFPVMPPQ